MSVVGIDLGTTNTVVACVRSGKVHVLADEQGQRLLPSVVSFHPNGDVLVGAAAKSRRVIDPRNTIYSHKRLIGRSWGSPEIAQAKQRFAFELKEGPGQGPLVHARGSDYTLPEISAFVLKRARQIAEQALGTPIERAVITVPAHFNELQRASTKVAGRVSGLEVLRILNEPTAAALAYGLGRTGNERVAVYDFGGGTFDCTLLDLNGNVFEVLATAGDSFLGGDDVDNMIAERMADTFLKQHRYDPRQDPSMYERLKVTAEEIKMVLSTAETHTVILKEFGQGLSSGGSSINFNFTLNRKELDAMIMPLVERSFKVTQDALSLARLTPTSFDKVILVGGSTRIPLVRKRVESFFGAPPMDRVNPDEVVAIGAAIQAAALTEGARKRSIPAPPPVPGGNRTMPGVQNDDTQTGTMDRDELKPAFGSNPPAFGFSAASARPPQTKSGPPPLGVSGARPPPDALSGGRKITNPGVAPATQPLGARGSAKPAPPPQHGADNDDPSMASFPDLAVPTPFEWFPSGQPSGEGKPGEQPSERSFGGNTITKTGVEQNTLTAAAQSAPASKKKEGFGAIDEPPSMYSSPDMSVPSFPSMATGGSPAMPSPIGEPEPMRPSSDDLPGQFGQVRDLSLISSTGSAPTGASGVPISSKPGEFGHVSDLSLISTNTATAAMDAITSARKKALDDGQFDDETEARKRPDDEPDLPAVAERADLPAVMQAKKPGAPQVRKSGQVGMGASGGSAMLGKPPPAVAPQPFGPMERIDEQPESMPSHTAAMRGRPQSPPPKVAPTKQSPAVQAKGARPNTQMGPQGQPPGMGTTAPLGQRAPEPNRAPPTQAFGSPAAPPPAFGSGQPIHNLPVQPPPVPGFGAPAQPFGSAPPPPVTGSQPPIFGAFPSSPPQPEPHQPMGGGQPLEPDMFNNPATASMTGAPQRVGGLGFAAPVLVDVTPRALVVETAGGYTDTIIPRNSKIPCERTRRFATGRDMQTTVRVRVGQGENQFFPQNTYLGEVELSGLRPAPRGEVVVAVTFECDADGTLRIRARDVQTGQEARATLQLVGVADESSVVMMINRFAQQPVVGGGPTGMQ